MPKGVSKKVKTSSNAKGKHWKIKDTSNMKGKHNGVEFKKGCTPWNKGKESLETRNENNPMWKGDKVGYLALHAWIARKLGKPKKCEHCKVEEEYRQYDWANIDHSYKRNLGDWLRLCVPCHRKYDYTNNLEHKNLCQR